MANLLKAKETNQFKVSIPRFKNDNYYAEYEVSVKCSETIEWKTYKRYSDFKRLKDELIKNDDRYRVFFPPKKSFNNMSTKFLADRRKSLEMYLSEVVSICGHNFARPLALFLEMDKYEVHGITTATAKFFFDHGHLVLNSNKAFEISVLLIHSINQRMSSPVPTNLYKRPDEDFGNVLDVVESMKKVKIVPNSVYLSSPDKCYGASSINLTDLTFDLSIFTSVTDLEMNGIEISNLKGLFKMNNTVERLRVHFCLKSMEDLLLADFAFKESSIGHLQKLDGPLRCATEVDFSNNSITCIDSSVVTLRQVRLLNLAHNQICDIQHMQHLTFLSSLDLSYNNLHMLQFRSLSTKLGSVKKLSLKGNKLTSLVIVDRMFSLEHLDVSDNRISDSASMLSLCRLSCLESLFMKDNPICSQSDFLVLVYDLFLDRYEHVRVNGYVYAEVALNLRTSLDTYRTSMRAAILSDSSFVTSNSVESRGWLTSVDINDDDCDIECLCADSVLAITDMYNVFIYWFFVATGSHILPRRLLWATEIFAPSRSLRPLQVLLATSGTHSSNMLKCLLTRSTHPTTGRPRLTVYPSQFLDLNTDVGHVVVAADKSFLRLDRNVDIRELYLCSDVPAVDGFICHLYHVDHGVVGFGDARVVHLNEEDRMEMLRRFVDVWRLEMAVTVLRNGENVEICVDNESELLFISRSMLQMKNGFQILLTVVVTREILYLVDERVYDWPSFNKQPSLSDLSSGNSCSPYTSSCGPFPFLRTNAYPLCQIKVCADVCEPIEDRGLVDKMCPLFRHPVQIAFDTVSQVPKNPLKLLFENEHKTAQLCEIVHQHSGTARPSATAALRDEGPLVARQSLCDTPANLRHMSSSYSEIRLSLLLSHPKLSQLAQSPAGEVLSVYQTVVPQSREATVFGLVWLKFIYLNFEVEDGVTAGRERPGLVCLSSSGVHVLYEVEERHDSDNECHSDPEADQPDVSYPVTKMETVSVDARRVFKVHVGLNHQLVTLCCRVHDGVSENERLVLVVRNKHLCKHILSWVEGMAEQGSPGDGSVHGCMDAPVEYAHHGSDVKELLYQIKRASSCGDIDFVHYCSLEDVRFDPSMPSRSLSSTSCNDMFSSAAVVTTLNIAIVRHNITEYPVREFAQGTIRQSPRHLQYQVMVVIPLFDCLHLQLPGHDRSVLIVVIKSSSNNFPYASTLNVQLSISCQNEQKRLIDKLRHQRSACLQILAPLRVSVC